MAKRKKLSPIERALAGVGQDVSGGAKKTAKKAVKRRSSGPVVLPNADPYTQLKEAGALDRKGRQKNAGPPRKPAERKVIVRGDKGKVRAVSPKRAKKIAVKRTASEAARQLQAIEVLGSLEKKGLLEDILEETPTGRALGLTKRVVDAADVDVGKSLRFATTQRAPVKDGGKGKKKGTVGAVVASRSGPRTFAGSIPAQVAIQTGRAFGEKPGPTSVSTYKGLRDMLYGIPSAAVKAVEDPVGTAEEYVEDVKRRYGPLAEGNYEKYRKRIQKEGAAAELADVAGIVAPVGGRAVGAGLKASGGKGKSFMEKERPKLRTSGGESRKQQLSDNALTVAIQRRHDKARRKKTEKRKARAAKQGVGAPVLDVVVKADEVAPIRRKRQQIKGPRGVATRKGRGVQALKREQSVEVHRGATKNIAQLNKHEQLAFKYALQLGIRTPAAAEKALTKRRKDIVRERDAEGTVVPELRKETNDELKVIDHLLENPEQAFTPRLAQVVATERKRGLRVAATDPGLAPEQRLRRRYVQQAEHLGVRRRTGEAAEGPIEKRLEAAYREIRDSKTGAELSNVKVFPFGDRLRISADIVLKGDKIGRFSRVYRPESGRVVKERTDVDPAHQRQGIATRLSRSEEGALSDRGISGLEVVPLSDAGKALNKRLGDWRDVPDMPGRMAKDLPKPKRETTAEFVKRVRAAAEGEGLTRPGYFPSQKRPSQGFSEHALGGTKAAAKDKTYTGALFRTGRENVKPEAFVQGLAKNIKRKHNWNTVADNFDAHVFKELGTNKTIGQLLDELDRRGIDAGDVAFWNPRTYRKARQEFEGTDALDEAFGDDIAPPGVGDAVAAASVDLKGLATKGEDFKGTSGWSVVPKAVHDEIHADTRPSTAAARSWDVVKGKQSRILLGSLNLPWVQFQVASNAFLSALGKTGPIDALKAQAWWRKLPESLKRDTEPYVGVGAFHVDVQQAKLGASTNNRLVNAYRAFKASGFFHKKRIKGRVSVTSLNPLDALFRFDNAQNNFFRKAMLYSQVKRDAYARMGKNVSGAANTQNRIAGLLTLGPTKQIEALLNETPTLERHASYVDGILGDYTTYSALERRTLARGIMFYGFLRHSLHLTFWTMPTKHPITTSIIANLGRMQTEEVRALLGGDELPFALGKLYYTKDGKLRSIDVQRANPALNSMVQNLLPGGNPGKVLGMLPPIVTTALDLAFQKTLFKGKTLRVGGETGYAATLRESTSEGIGAGDNLRILTSRALRLAYPYRLAEDIVYKGQPQGDDTLLWSPRPTKYKDEEIVQSIKKRMAEEPSAGNVILHDLVPWLGKPSHDPEFARSIREKRKGKEKAPSSSSLLGSAKRSTSLLDSQKRTTSLLDR